MQDNYKFIDKNDFLEATRGGFDFYQLVMRKQGKELHQDKPNSLLINPFYNDTKGSLSINYNNGKYLFNDFGKQSYSGDVFDFAGFYYNLNPKSELQQILINACKDLGLYRLLIEKETKKSGIKELIVRKKFLEFELDYWASYGISLDILQKFNVVSVDYLLLSKNFKLFSKKQNPIFAYKTENCYKVYQPLSKKYKFNWFPKKKIDTPFGYEQLPEKGELIIITSGEKDVLTLNSQGFNAICLNSETQTKIDDNLLKEIKSRFSTIAVLYDLDDTGEKSALALANQYGFQYIKLPMEMMQQKLGKDVSDYFKLVKSGANLEMFSLEQFQELVEKSLVPTKQVELPEVIYANLPEFFSNLIEKFKKKQEKDLILLSAIVAISACLPNYQGFYDNFYVFPNLYLFIVGNAAHGKGIIKFSRILVLEIDKSLRESAKKTIIENQNVNNESKEVLVTPKMLLLPANSSSTGFFELLEKNNGCGLLFETEADTLSNIMKKEYGNYSDGLRNGFHHEPISYFRRQNKEYININNPKISIVFTGTPNQVYNLFPNSEDGLLSRFFFYILTKEQKFHNVFEEKDNRIENYFFQKSIEIKRIYDDLIIRTSPLNFQMTEEQQSQFTEYFRSYEDYIEVECGVGGKSILFRHGLIFFRILMILTFFRNTHKIKDVGVLISNNIDFETTKLIIEILIKHSITIFKSYPEKENRIIQLSGHYQLLYKELPNEFKREDVLPLCVKFGLSVPSFDRLLQNKHLFDKIKQGCYRKKT